MDLWASVRSSKRHPSAVVPATGLLDGGLVMDGAEGGDDDVRAWFPCPFCYVEIQVPLLCCHLQEEHCFDLRNSVCPICAANLGKDATGHFTLQHAHSIKWRRNSQKSSGFWSISTGTSAMIGKDLLEPSAYLGSNSTSGKSNVHEATPDPILSPFLCHVPLSIHKVDQEDESSAGITTTISVAKSSSSSSSRTCMPRDEVEGQDCEEKRKRAAFLQQLIISTVF